MKTLAATHSFPNDSPRRKKKPVSIPTKQAIQEFVVSRGGLRPKTRKEYQKHLRLFELSFPCLPRTPQPIQAWLNSLLRERGDQPLAPETVHARFRTLRAFYKQTHLWHPRIPNPMPLIRPPRLLPKAMRTFTVQDIYLIFNLPLTLRERAMFMLFLDTGLRATECANLTWDNVYPEYITVSGKTGERDVPINEPTFQLLRRLKAESGRDTYAFQGKRGRLTYEGIYKTIRHICLQAGITGRRTSPHTFRHTFGTEYASSPGADPKVLQDIMGHRDFKTTLRYIHNNRRRLINNHRLCSPLRMISSATQGSLFESEAVKEAEQILEEGRSLGNGNKSTTPGPG